MIETEFCLFEMEVEGVSGHTAELCQASFCEAPEALNAVDVVALAGALVVPMLDLEVLVETRVDKTVVACPAVGVEHGAEARSAPNHSL